MRKHLAVLTVCALVWCIGVSATFAGPYGCYRNQGCNYATGARRVGEPFSGADGAAPPAHCSNAALHAPLKFSFCRRRQAVMARTLGISPAHSR
jgi:hypothetical protein